MNEDKVIHGLTKIIPYMLETHNFRLNFASIRALMKSHGFPVRKISGKYITRTVLLDQWIKDLTENKLIEAVKSEHAKALVIPRKKRKKNRRKWRYDVPPQRWEAFMKEFEGFRTFRDKRNRLAFLTAAKNLLKADLSVGFTIRLLEQVFKATYNECMNAYVKEGVPYLKFRNPRTIGTWRYFNAKEKEDMGEDGVDKEWRM